MKTLPICLLKSCVWKVYTKLFFLFDYSLLIVALPCLEYYYVIKVLTLLLILIHDFIPLFFHCDLSMCYDTLQKKLAQVIYHVMLVWLCYLSRVHMKFIPEMRGR